MGVVYSAYDEDLDRRVAVKILARQRPSDAQRMLREAQVLARLNHPNVVQVYEVGRHMERVFIAMEFVQGDNLRDWLADHKRGWSEILAAFVQAARGLQVVHEARLVHRDFKPDNAVIGEDGRVRVLDFGIARLEGAPDEQPSTPAIALERLSSAISTDKLTRTGQFIGTPAYMSPEQVRGDAVTASSDQFSFCISLYEALYGTRPFRHRNIADLLMRLMEGKVDDAPPDSDVPLWLREAVVAGLAPDPDQRYASMAALIEALCVDPSARRKRRTRWLAGGAVIASAVAVSLVREPQQPQCDGAEAALADVWSAARADQIAAVAGTDLQEQAWAAGRRGVDAYSARWIAGFTNACLANLRHEQSDAALDLRMRCLTQKKRRLDALLDVLHRDPDATLNHAPDAVAGLESPESCSDLERLSQSFAPPDPSIAEAVDTMWTELSEAKAMHTVGLFEETRDSATRIAERAEALGYKPLAAAAMHVLGNAHQGVGDPGTATEHYLMGYYAAVSGDHQRLETELTVSLIANLGLQQRKYDQAAPWIRLAEALIKRDGTPPVLEANFLAALGGIREQQGRLDDAQTALARALQLRQEHDTPMSLAPVHNALGLVRQRLGDVDQAEQDFSAAIATWQEFGGEFHPQVADGYNNLGVLLMHAGRFEQSAEAYQQALTIRRKVLGDKSPMVARTLNNLGALAQKQHDWGGASRWYAEALAQLDRSLGAMHPSLSIPLNNLGDVELSRDDYVAARPYYERALAIDEAALGPEHRDLSYELLGLGRCDLLASRPGAALTRLERALRLRVDNEFPPTEVGRVRFFVGQARWDLGETDAGLVEIRRAAKEAAPDEGFSRTVTAWLAAHVPA